MILAIADLFMNILILYEIDAFSVMLNINPSKHACSVIISLPDLLYRIYHHQITHYYIKSLYLF